jgi:hypothetical protein
MFNRTDSNVFVRRVLSGLTISVAMLAAALSHAVSNVQSFV